MKNQSKNYGRFESYMYSTMNDDEQTRFESELESEKLSKEFEKFKYNKFECYIHNQMDNSEREKFEYMLSISKDINEEFIKFKAALDAINDFPKRSAILHVTQLVEDVKNEYELRIEAYVANNLSKKQRKKFEKEIKKNAFLAKKFECMYGVSFAEFKKKKIPNLVYLDKEIKTPTIPQGNHRRDKISKEKVGFIESIKHSIIMIKAKMGRKEQLQAAIYPVGDTLATDTTTRHIHIKPFLHAIAASILLIIGLHISYLYLETKQSHIVKNSVESSPNQCPVSPKNSCDEFTLDFDDRGASWMGWNDMALDISISVPNNILDDIEVNGKSIDIEVNSQNISDELIIAYELAQVTSSITFDITDLEIKQAINTNIKKQDFNANETIVLGGDFEILEGTDFSATIKDVRDEGNMQRVSHSDYVDNIPSVDVTAVSIENCTEPTWPGDYNYDGTADESDALHWRLAYDYIDTGRSDATTTFELQQDPDDWSQDVQGINGKHLDGDGNGIVNGLDLQVVIDNFGSTHNYTESIYIADSMKYQLVKVDSIEDSSSYDLYVYDNAGSKIEVHGLSGVLEFCDTSVAEVFIRTDNSSLLTSNNHSVYDTLENHFHFTLTRTDKTNKIYDDNPVANFIVAVEDISSGETSQINRESYSESQDNCNRLLYLWSFPDDTLALRTPLDINDVTEIQTGYGAIEGGLNKSLSISEDYFTLAYQTEVASHSQPVNYTVKVSGVEWNETQELPENNCFEWTVEEYSAIMWFNDNLNSTKVGDDNRFTCNSNSGCTITPNVVIGSRNNTCAETIDIIFEGFENGERICCNKEKGDNCSCGQVSVASINFRNDGPGCKIYNPFGNRNEHNASIEICWDYTESANNEYTSLSKDQDEYDNDAMDYSNIEILTDNYGNIVEGLEGVSYNPVSKTLYSVELNSLDMQRRSHSDYVDKIRSVDVTAMSIENSSDLKNINSALVSTEDTIVSDFESHELATTSKAMGYQSFAHGVNSFTLGHQTKTVVRESDSAFSDSSSAYEYGGQEGNSARATTFGYRTTANVEDNTAIGNATTASGYMSFVEGHQTQPTAIRYTALGASTRSNGISATATGSHTHALGDTPPRTYYVLFVADAENELSESNENNNFKCIQIHVSSANLNCGDDISMLCTQSYSDSQLDTNLPSFGVDYYLSTDAIFDNSDIWLGGNVSSLDSDDISPDKIRYPNIVSSYNNLGLVYEKIGDYEKAISFYNKALNTRIEVLGEKYPNIASSYNNLGTVYSINRTTHNDIAFSNQWGLDNVGQNGGTEDADIDTPEAWDVTLGSPSVVLAIIDTGIDWGHKDLVDNIWQNVVEDTDGDGKVIIWNGSAWVFDPDDEKGIDDDGNVTEDMSVSDTPDNSELIESNIPKEKLQKNTYKNVVLAGHILYDLDNKSKNEKEGIVLEDENRNVRKNIRKLSKTLHEVAEIDKVGKQIKLKTNLFPADTILEDTVQYFVGERTPNIIHFATHGVFPPPSEKPHYKDDDLTDTRDRLRAANNPLQRCALMLYGANETWTRSDSITKHLPNGLISGVLMYRENKTVNTKPYVLTSLLFCKLLDEKNMMIISNGNVGIGTTKLTLKPDIYYTPSTVEGIDRIIFQF